MNVDTLLIETEGALTKARLPIEFLNVELANAFEFFMNPQILASTEFYIFIVHKKIVTQNNLPLQAFATLH